MVSMIEIRTLIQVLKEHETQGGGDSKLTVSMLRCFLEESERKQKEDLNNKIDNFINRQK